MGLTGTNLRRLVIPAVAVSAAILVILARVPDEDGSLRQFEPALLPSGAPNPAVVAPGRQPTEAEAPSSVAVSLLQATEGDRNTRLRQSLLAAGLDCPEVPISHPIGNDGSVWRADCGGTTVYRIDVDPVGQLHATPMPYGDVWPGTDRPAIQGGRTLQFREP